LDHEGYYYGYAPPGVVISCPPDCKFLDPERAQERVEHDGPVYAPWPQAGPNVDGYHVFAQIIAGHVSPPIRVTSYGDPIRLADNEIQPVGYFVIDVRHNTIRSGLSKEEWTRVLKSYGINHEPELYKPSIYDKILGRNRPGKD
jgi:hypothetical protein